MVRTEQLAEAALSGDALLLRSLAQDWLSENGSIAQCARPRSEDRTILAIAAGIVELLAQRRGQMPPIWAISIGGIEEPLFLVRSAQSMPRLRYLCETQSPIPLRKRNLLAPPTFLEFA
ncbi:MAG TPA: hypothetical protein VH370_06335 [Humisphaera sp.]|jgi:hypothetical protein|nr:hypothetical protein [Humisphaera sp.]